MEEYKVVRVTPGENNEVSAADMVVALAKSGVALEDIALFETLNEADRTFVRIAIEQQ